MKPSKKIRNTMVKRAIAILLLLTMSVVVLAGCTDVSNENTNDVINDSETKTENGVIATDTSVSDSGLQYSPFFYERTNWDALPEKEVDFKISGCVSAPFDLKNFEDAVESYSAYRIFAGESDFIKIIDETDFNTLTDGTKSVEPTYSLSSESIYLDLKNDCKVEMTILATKEEVENGTLQNVMQAVSEGRYCYFTNEYDMDKFLDVDMEGLSATDGNGIDYNNIFLLEKTIEKFGKPTEVTLNSDSRDVDGTEEFLSGTIDYSLVYEYEDYVLYIRTYETQVVFGDDRDYEQIIMSPRVYGKEAWRLYKENGEQY